MALTYSHSYVLYMCEKIIRVHNISRRAIGSLHNFKQYFFFFVKHVKCMILIIMEEN